MLFLQPNGGKISIYESTDQRPSDLETLTYLHTSAFHSPKNGRFLDKNEKVFFMPRMRILTVPIA